MPPKKDNQPSKKTLQKKNEKTIEDKTFGLKNKKGSKQQKFIDQVQKQVSHGNKSLKELELEKQKKMNKKELEKKEREELNLLFKPVAEMQKVAKGVDPKSVLCVFFKQGTCKKGDKCKFSHDLTIERKTVKKSLYADGKGEEDAMDDWDQDKLEEVVAKKHGDSNKSLPATSIICKHFLDAVENNKYGWFWNCPGGAGCHYRHALPAGFVLKKDKKRMEEQEEKVTLEELIEKERQALTASMHTPVTLESFLRWKKRKKEEKIAAMEESKAKRRKDFSSGRMLGVSGREVFEFNPDLVDEEGEDDEGDGAVFDSRLRERDEDEASGMKIREIRFDEYDVDTLEAEARQHQEAHHNGENGKLSLAAGGGAPDVDVDENLFDDGDLDELDEELNDLELDES